ncbi:MAG: NUDIX domain-containing protein [Thermoproteota archaeon]
MIGKNRTPSLTVDVVIRREDGSIVLVKRKNPPFKGFYALPGGFVEYGETVEAAAIREAREETGLDIELTQLLGVYSDPKRDPRGHMVSIVYLAERKGGTLRASSDAQEVECLNMIPEQMAFDHRKILNDASNKA